MGINPAALIWGFAEATLFFIVPDVWLSFAGREKLSKGIRACFFALAGALIGGTLMYAWGHLHAESAFQSLEKIPGINQPVIDQAGAELEQRDTERVQVGASVDRAAPEHLRRHVGQGPGRASQGLGDREAKID